MRTLAVLLAGLVLAGPALAENLILEPLSITEWKAVYGRVEAKDTVPARARIGGLIVSLDVSEGDRVHQGQTIATVQDDKIAFQIDAADAQLRALAARLKTAETELGRGQTLVERGVVSTQRLDQLRTDVDVTRNDIAATDAERALLVQQQAEGAVLSPLDGRVLDVPVTRGGVVLAGETVASIGGGGFYLRLAIPERYAASLEEGADIRVTANELTSVGRLVKIYPRIENGRVLADVEVDDLDVDFVDARVLVEVPVGERTAILVPAAAVETRSGIDFVRMQGEGGGIERAVVTGDSIKRDDKTLVEILTGLEAGDTVLVP